MGDYRNKKIFVTWSGGVDSTALLGHLMSSRFEVYPITILFGDKIYRENEHRARQELAAFFKKDSWYSQYFNETVLDVGDFLKVFSPDNGQEVPRRNKHILDYIMMNYVIPNDGYYIGMGTYIGADSSTTDHLKVGMDTDSRYMSSYLLSEYGINYRLMSLADFGESRFKTDHVSLLYEVVEEPDLMFRTYNCLGGVEIGKHCGSCYKCVERFVAFNNLLGYDNTLYTSNPEKSPLCRMFKKHFNGEKIPTLKWDQIKSSGQGKHF